MLKDLKDLLNRHDLFIDPDRPEWTNRGPHVLVIDDFYENPNAIRALGLGADFVQYSPPTTDQIGRDQIDWSQFDNVTGRIYTTAMKAFRGVAVQAPVYGFRHNPPSLQRRMEALIGCAIDPDSWEPGGDYWNGAFNLREAGTDDLDTIHHHYHETNAQTYGWNGVVYLSPEVPPGRRSGTSFWQHKPTGKCVGGYGELFSLNATLFSPMAFVPYKYNRLVLFRENVLHKVEGGFGIGRNARLTQSFFFQALPPAHER